MRATARFTLRKEAEFAEKMLLQQHFLIEVHKEASAEEAWILYVSENKAFAAVRALQAWPWQSMEALIGMA